MAHIELERKKFERIIKWLLANKFDTRPLRNF